MDQLVDVFKEMVEKLSEISDKMDYVTSAIENLQGPLGYKLDDIHRDVVSAIENLQGSLGYNLEDIFNVAHSNHKCNFASI